MNASQTVSCKPNPEKERARGYLEESIPDSRFKVTRWGGAGGGGNAVVAGAAGRPALLEWSREVERVIREGRGLGDRA